MTADFTTAQAEMFGLLKTALDFGAAAIVGYVPTVYWPGVEPSAQPPVDQFYLHVMHRPVSSRQSSLSPDVGAVGQRRYNVRGALFFQVFCPLSDSQAVAKGRDLALLARDAFRNPVSPSDIEFANQRIDIIGNDAKHFQYNVIIEYNYDDIG